MGSLMHLETQFSLGQVMWPTEKMVASWGSGSIGQVFTAQA